MVQWWIFWWLWWLWTFGFRTSRKIFNSQLTIKCSGQIIEWGETMSLWNCSCYWAHCPAARWYINGHGAAVESHWWGKTKELREKLVPVPLCPPQIPHKLPLERTWTSAVRIKQLTAWATKQPWQWSYSVMIC
jgi:hypothetical protein